MDINKIELWKKPEGSYSYAAFKTYSSKLFNLRTGEKVSVLSSRKAINFTLELAGPVKVTTDRECWKILFKFDRIDEFIDGVVERSEEIGNMMAKKELRQWLQVIPI